MRLTVLKLPKYSKSLKLSTFKLVKNPIFSSNKHDHLWIWYGCDPKIVRIFSWAGVCVLCFFLNILLFIKGHFILRALTMCSLLKAAILVSTSYICIRVERNRDIKAIKFSSKKNPFTLIHASDILLGISSWLTPADCMYCGHFTF